MVPKIERRRIILDCDPGLDDAVAIALAVSHADVVGITAVGGNVSLERTTTNALALCDLLGRPDIPVHAGHDQPMSGSLAHRATEYHGPQGTGSVRLPLPSRPPTSTDAVQWIIDTARAEPTRREPSAGASDPEGLWLVATGPLTNVAYAIQQAPDIIDRLAGISWMGGSSTCGNTTAAAEFNAWVDPEAADVVFRAGHPRLTMVGLNITHTVLLDRVWIDELRVTTRGNQQGKMSSVFVDLLDYYEARQRSITTLAGAAVHDALAVLWVTHPQLFAGIARPVEVVVSEGPARGMTLVDQRPRRQPAAPNCNVIEWADAAVIRALIGQALT